MAWLVGFGLRVRTERLCGLGLRGGVGANGSDCENARFQGTKKVHRAEAFVSSFSAPLGAIYFLDFVNSTRFARRTPN